VPHVLFNLCNRIELSLTADAAKLYDDCFFVVSFIMQVENGRHRLQTGKRMIV
jgi:hypothetical protein